MLAKKKKGLMTRIGEKAAQGYQDLVLFANKHFTFLGNVCIKAVLCTFHKWMLQHI